MDKLKRVLTGRDAEEPSDLAQVIDATSLGWGTRVKGFIACFAIGCLCSILHHVSYGTNETIEADV